MEVLTFDYMYFQIPALVKEFGSIDYIDFSPVEPHYFAVTCSVRVSTLLLNFIYVTF
jgi:U3 small nucleolar RNA-associated protein 15